MPIRVTILGSGTIIPSIERRSTALLIEAGERILLFDCGPAILDAIEETGLSYRAIDTIFLTHFHADHTLGIGHLLAARKNDCEGTDGSALTLYGPCGLVSFMDRWNELYHSLVSAEACLELVEVDSGDAYAVGEALVRAAPADHGGHPAFAYRIEYGNRTIVLTGDSAYTQSIVALADGADLLVSECSFPDSSPKAGHMTPLDAGRMAKKAGVGRVVLVHLYPAFEGTDPTIGVKRHYSGPVDVAWDGMVIEL